MASRDIRYISTLSAETGINRKTLATFVDNQIKRYDTEILERLCKYFDCQVGDLLEKVDED